MSKEIIFMKPVIKENVWGGSRLVTEYHYLEQGEGLGECWGISAHSNGDGEVANGTYAGMKLSELYKEHRELFGDIKEEVFPLLVKIIDARENLSIQVHPDDAYASVHENGSLGKTECWYIIDCPEDAKLVIGHNASTREELKEMVYAGKYDELIRQIPIKKGDFIQINPGTVHAITGGILLLETQQSSDITYRVYDYGRLVDGKPRPIHVEQSIEVITVPDTASNEVIHAAELGKNEMALLVSCPFYKVWKLDVEGTVEVDEEVPFMLGSVMEGEGALDGVTLKKGDHFILPKGYGRMQLTGSLQMIFSTVN